MKLMEKFENQPIRWCKQAPTGYHWVFVKFRSKFTHHIFHGETKFVHAILTRQCCQLLRFEVSFKKELTAKGSSKQDAVARFVPPMHNWETVWNGPGDVNQQNGLSLWKKRPLVTGYHHNKF